MLIAALLACVASDTAAPASDGGSPGRVTYRAGADPAEVPGLPATGAWQALHCAYLDSGSVYCVDATDEYALLDDTLCSTSSSASLCTIVTTVADEVRIAYW